MLKLKIKSLNNYIDRDISWLSFNERVLQEAEKENNPIIERLKFLAIYSSNLEEFYKVRVARQRRFAYAEINKPNKFGFRPTEILNTIYRTVDKQQQKFGRIYRKSILPELSKQGYHIVQSPEDPEIISAAKSIYKTVEPFINIENISKKGEVFLKNQMNYLLVVTKKKKTPYRYHLVEIDPDRIRRFHIHRVGEDTFIFLVDDIIRFGIQHQYLDEKFVESYALKLSRDAELYLEDEPIEKDLKQKIQDSLKKRESGEPSRLLFDEMIPYKFLNEIMDKTKVDRQALIPGGRYHRFYDFFEFPKQPNPKLYYSEEKSLPSLTIQAELPILEQILENDIFLAFPYQDYNTIVDVIHEASIHPDVSSIHITLYRVANDSLICQNLEKAALKGKQVVVYTELKARFDESSNLYWNKRLKEAGAIIYDEVENYKTHAKIFQIQFTDGHRIAHLGTGNFNEKTAKVYTDYSLLTSSEDINAEISNVFSFLTAKVKHYQTKALMCSPFGLRNQIVELINHEIQEAKAGNESYMILKMNSLEDTAMIDKLYEASSAGVKIDLIIRGICCLKAGVKDLSENINLYSIVGRYLEHARCFYFYHSGKELIYCSSADLMKRNLDSRVEVAFPINEERYKEFLKTFLILQLKDNTNRRILNAKLLNNVPQKDDGESRIDAQKDIRELIAKYKL